MRPLKIVPKTQDRRNKECGTCEFLLEDRCSWQISSENILEEAQQNQYFERWSDRSLISRERPILVRPVKAYEPSISPTVRRNRETHV